MTWITTHGASSFAANPLTSKLVTQPPTNSDLASEVPQRQAIGAEPPEPVGYTDCNLSPSLGVEEQHAQAEMERAVFSCDYNGWADVPEEEREAIEAFEATLLPPQFIAFIPPVAINNGVAGRQNSRRRAA